MIFIKKILQKFVTANIKKLDAFWTLGAVFRIYFEN